MLEDVGGFWDEPAYEDLWSLFRAFGYGGSTIEHVPMLYYAYNLGGRNRFCDRPSGRLRKLEVLTTWIKELN